MAGINVCILIIVYTCMYSPILEIEFWCPEFNDAEFVIQVERLDVSDSFIRLSTLSGLDGFGRQIDRKFLQNPLE
jgi:hypothetical protein